jgi:hypothetical protein
MDNQESTSVAVVVELPNSEPVRGERGEVGTATAGLTIKQKWKASTSHVSLKVFARTLAKSGDQAAKDWFAHKKGSLNQARTDANIKAAREAAVATHTERRKKKAQK